MGTGIRLVAATSLLMLPALSNAEEFKKVPRENGAVHQEFRVILKSTLDQFRSGVGRVEIPGKSDENNVCLVNLYTTQETTYVTLDSSQDNFYNEFYIDHPRENFNQILFQNVIRDKKKTALNVVQRDGSYAIESDGKQLKVTTTSDNVTHSCQFELSQAKWFEGETE